MEDAQTSPEKKEKVVPAPAAEKVAKPKATAKAKPAAKPKPEAKPLVDNGDGTITDPNTGLMWKKSDAWIDMHRFYTWMDHREYVDKVNKEKFAGYDNWRIPSKSEAMSIFDKTKKCMDKNGIVYAIDPIFEAGGASNTWISECTEDKIIRFDFKVGVDTPYPTKDVWSSMRLVRKEGEAPPAPVGKEPDAVEAEAVPAATEVADSGAVKPAAPKPVAAKTGSGGAVPKPIPKKDFSSEERAAMRARAKAHAAEVKARKAKG